jgi:hypothetical protein
MKALVRRLTRLEQSRTSFADLWIHHVAHTLWERRQRRLQAEGLPFETIEPEYPPGPRMSCAETLRLCRQERVARNRTECEKANNGT